jgi:hypothetical protein
LRGERNKRRSSRDEQSPPQSSRLPRARGQAFAGPTHRKISRHPPDRTVSVESHSRLPWHHKSGLSLFHDKNQPCCTGEVLSKRFHIKGSRRQFFSLSGIDDPAVRPRYYRDVFLESYYPKFDMNIVALQAI